ncbi:lasso RiPP family leader peptide-containing protein [Nonomuraea basaltis]|nr:lasso RiPP family leader peptide-containing protein [Nonomuraea basaltis]
MVGELGRCVATPAGHVHGEGVIFVQTVSYEAPQVVELGDFAELTRGEFGDWPDYPVGLWL